MVALVFLYLLAGWYIHRFIRIDLYGGSIHGVDQDECALLFLGLWPIGLFMLGMAWFVNRCT
jgi:hypothetical protein